MAWEVHRLSERDNENTRLKKIITVLTLNPEVLQEGVKQPEDRRIGAPPQRSEVGPEALSGR